VAALADTKLLADAYRELRAALVKGQVAELEAAGARIVELLDTEDRGELAPATLHLEAIGWLCQGLSAILDGGNLQGLAELEHITERELDDDSLKWGAWLWTYRAAIGAGAVERARSATLKVTELAERLADPRAIATSLCAVAEIGAITGEASQAIEHLARAQTLYRELGDRGEEAAAALAQARVLARTGRSQEAEAAAARALELAPSWADPTLFLATQELQEGALEPAARRLASLDPPSPEASLLLGLIAGVEDGRVPRWVAKDYLRLREELPGPEVAEELGALLVYSPRFHHLKVELAWKLLRLGKLDEAEQHLRELQAAPDLDAALRPSVMLGVSSLVSLRQRHRPPGARAQAAVAAARPPSIESPPLAAAEEEVESQELVAEPPSFDLGRAVSAAGADGTPSSEPHDLLLRQAIASVERQRSVFSGDLHLLSTADLLEFLKNGRRTGMLIIQSAQGIGAIHLRSGAITGASSPGCINLGDLLLGWGAISSEQLEQAAAAQKEDRRGALMGAIFVERGLVPLETMEKALSQQVISAIREMYRWSDGRFAFLSDGTSLEFAPPPSIEVELDTQFVLLEVARQLDEENAPPERR
jgi:tetratricopeptide (TPR) repeat protein